MARCRDRGRPGSGDAAGRRAAGSGRAGAGPGPRRRRGDPGRGDEQQPGPGSAPHRHRAGGRAEPGPGHPGHRDAGPGVRIRAQAGTAGQVPAGVAVGHQQAQAVPAAQDRAQRQKLTQAEPARPARRYPGQDRGAFAQQVREGGIGVR
jgi:hypothetical protein